MKFKIYNYILFIQTSQMNVSNPNSHIKKKAGDHTCNSWA